MSETPQLPESGPEPVPPPSHAEAGAPEFVALFLAEQRRIYCYIFTLLANAQDAEDLLQETAAVLWKKFGEFQPGTSFFSWACQIAHYQVLNYRRRKGRHEVMLDDDVLEQLAEVPPAEAEMLAIRQSALHDCLKKLTHQDRSLFERRYASTAKGKDLAAELGRPADSIYRSLGRIRRLLMECVRRTILAADHEGGRT